MSVVALFAAARDALAARRRRTRAYTELAALDDRSLADIGIHRSQIPEIVTRAQCAAKQARPTHSQAASERASFLGGHGLAR
ncbi:MAG TPA: DUF1127 domain-containing protein [Stellaceae bacterium]|jgi:uncharacterized protein YjiS (DUF1127 family)|nr:DUF1127 domain-containing protein [Stellaceae bacterium]